MLETAPQLDAACLALLAQRFEIRRPKKLLEGVVEFLLGVVEIDLARRFHRLTPPYRRAEYPWVAPLLLWRRQPRPAAAADRASGTPVGGLGPRRPQAGPSFRPRTSPDAD